MYNPAGQITTSINAGIVSTYTYDLDGNNSIVRTGASFVTMGYDQENRLTQHVDGSTYATFTYQPDSMKRNEVNGATITTLIWDGSDYLGAL